MSIVFGKNVTNTYFAQIVWVNLVLGHGVHISEEKNWILLTRRKREKREKEKERKRKKTESYSPGERGPGAGPSGAGAVIIS